MKVLLLHEMSGVHTELRAALRQLGVGAKIATYGDGFKRYPTDINLGVASPGVFGNAGRISRQLAFMSRLKEFDVVQTISPNPFHRVVAPILERMTFNGDIRSVYVAAGSDAIYRKHVTELDYYPPHDWYDRPKEYARLKSMLGRVSKVVPVCWEYAYAMGRADVPCGDVIPFPINLDRHKPRSVGVRRKIRVFHPLNRTGTSVDFKGREMILRAFRVIEERFAGEVECVARGGLSHVDYDALTNSMDIIVDQAFSYTYGMSAAYGLAKGKVVLSGLEEDARVGFYSKCCPVVNIKPDCDMIVYTLSELLRNRHRIRELGEQSRAFAEEHHDHLRVGRRYIEIYERL